MIKRLTPVNSRRQMARLKRSSIIFKKNVNTTMELGDFTLLLLLWLLMLLLLLVNFKNLHLAKVVFVRWLILACLCSFALVCLVRWVGLAWLAE